jgi:hypothetical protein
LKVLPADPVDRAGIVRVTAYYAVVGLLAAWAIRAFPSLVESLTGGALPGVSWANPFGDGSAAVGVPVAQTPWTGAVLGGVSMLGALAIMVPVTWIYMVTRRSRGYDESVLHALLILPVAVTGIVMIVRDSIALAFSLAGIVAAVRFRTTLDDTKDAVYVFLAIGVGIACGVQALGLAVVLSLVFNAVVVVLWATGFGNPYAPAGRRGGSLPLGEALAGPGSGGTRRLVGDPALLEAAAPGDVAEALERAARLERHLSEERSLKKKERANALLLVSAGDAGAAQRAVDALLEGAVERWKLAEVASVPGGGWVLEYLVRVEEGSLEGTLLERIRGAAGTITAVELRSLRGLTSRS